MRGCDVAGVVAALWLTLCGCAPVASVEHHRRNPYDIHDYKDHPCRRTCSEAGEVMTCRYYFLVEHYTTLSAACYSCPDNTTDCSLPQCVTGAGLRRTVLAINRMVPGPAIHVCEGDTVEVVVDNRMELGEGTTIHWHGVRQLGSPYMDGTSMVTQCPITKWSKMKYRFKATDAGSHFWHSHAALQRSDGLFGSLIIRRPPAKDPHSPLYDEDLPEHTIMLNDWSRRPSADSIVALFHRGVSAYPSGILVNGRARAEGGLDIPYAEFQVKAGLRYRFRIIYSGILNCPIYIRVDGHRLLLLAADGRDFQPVEVDSFTIYSGERYDFVLQAKGEGEHGNGSYWMRFKGHNACSSRKIIQAAILRYGAGTDEEPAGEVTYDNTVPAAGEVTMSDETGVSSDTNIQIVDLKAVGPRLPEPDLVDQPDKKFYIALVRSPVPDDRFLTPVYPGCPDNTTDSHSSRKKRGSSDMDAATAQASDVCRNPTQRHNLQLNYITGRLPPAPPLTQYADIDQKLLCNGDNIERDCRQEICDCVHTLRVDRGDLVELVLVNPRAESSDQVKPPSDTQLVHPMHLHGHSARVVTMLRLNEDITLEALKSMDERGEIIRVRYQAPYKDTIPVGDRSVVIVRFRADNPGFWFFHCHIELHTELGMALILQSGRPDQMVQPPDGFPRCKNWPGDEEPPVEPRSLGTDEEPPVEPHSLETDEEPPVEPHSLEADGEPPVEPHSLETDEEPPKEPHSQETYTQPWVDAGTEHGCVGVCSNNTDEPFFTAESFMITGVAFLMCVSVSAMMFGVVYCLRRRCRRNSPRYHLMRRASHTQVGPYKSLIERER